MKRIALTGMLLASCVFSGLSLPQQADAGDCCGGCGGGRGPMRRMMGAYVAVMTMGMVTPNRASSSVVTTNAPLTPAPDAGATPPPPPAT